MSSHRFRIPAPPPPAPGPEAFVLMPVEALPAVSPDHSAYQKALYEWAFAEAQAVVQPSILERDLLGVWN